MNYSFRMRYLGAVVICCVWQHSAANNVTYSNNYFAGKIIESYGSNGTISAGQIEELLTSLSSTHPRDEDLIPPEDCDGDQWLLRESCLENKCVQGSDILALGSLPSGAVLNITQLASLSPALLYTAARHSQCDSTEHDSVTPSTAAVWGYSFLCVTVINLCSLMGMVFLPLMRRAFYQRLLMFMVALAVGTLVGSSLLFLIPEAFDMASEHNPNYSSYVWKSSTVIGGIYLFFLVERLLKHIMDYRNKKESLPVDPDVADLYDRNGGVGQMEESRHIISPSIPTHTNQRSETMNMSFDVPNQIHHLKDTRTCERNMLVPNMSAYSMQTQVSQIDTNQQTASVKEDKDDIPVTFEAGGSPGNSNSSSSSVTSSPIRSVAWMVIFGDGLHNFIDGLSIGAAFSKSILAGISISLAVVCEELPHELGDFAILLNSGMSMRQALGFNFLSACMCYVGLVLGILIGEMTEGSTWIFALAAGMFLYISLVDMLPEVNVAAEKEGKDPASLVKVFVIQNAGLLAGYGVMVILAIFSDRIDLEAVVDS